MRIRLPALLTGLLIPLLGAISEASANTLHQQRLLYDEARRALARQDPAPYLRHQQALAGYVLAPYLAYEALALREASASPAEIERFLVEHPDLPQSRALKLRWLRSLAERGDWQRFIRHYDPALESVELDCLFGEYQYRHNQARDGAVTARRLWLSGQSQPASCDRLFALWHSSGGLDEALRWQRLVLAAEARNYTLADFLQKALSPERAAAARQLIEVARQPERLLQRERFARTDQAGADTVTLGLRRLARQNPQQALALLEDYAARLPLSEEQRLKIAREIGLVLARRFDLAALEVMERYDPQLRDSALSEWRIRLLLRHQRFAEAYQLTQRLPLELAGSNRWRYWQARSLQLARSAQGEAATLYRALAKERDFYGFLAADQLRVPYRLNHRPAPVDAHTLQRIRQSPAIRRAMELHARGLIADSRREWLHASRLFNREELLAQARLGHELGWHFPAIRAITQAQYWDDLEVRFPMAHRQSMDREAQTRGLDPSWVFAITRQESAFMADARSHVGAMGLMQLMPATAKETAQRFGIPLRSAQQAYAPEVNIQLGAAYLSQVYRQFDGNRILASAAYNAGPGRVRQWLRGNEQLPFDVWIETIPFDETRQYVQNVLTYAVIYGDKLGAPRPLLDPHEQRLSQR